MQFEVIRKTHKKEIIIGVSIFIVLAIVLVVRFTFAKYSLVKSIKIAEGIINYKVPDFKIMAMYKQKEGSTCTEDNCYDEMAENEVMPESGYTINKTKSYCTLDNINKDTKAKLFTNEEGKHVIVGLSKSSKCYLYFDKVPTAGETILANVTLKNCGTSFTGVATTNEGVCTTKDDDGDTYYFRGAVENNYVKFAGFWWRIIRINGDGTIRLIYDGTSAHANGITTADSIAIADQKFSHKNAEFPAEYSNDNAYVGFKYTLGQVHGKDTKSNILEQLEAWYESNLSSYTLKIDTNAGFCGDREPSMTMGTYTGSGGTGTLLTYYGAYIRFHTNSGGWNTTQTPTFKCKNSSDLYTMAKSNKGNKSLSYPIGLITIDEVIYAGGFGGADNSNYYLYNGHPYWTLSPASFGGTIASMFAISRSYCVHERGVYDTIGIRPVINLRSDTQFTFEGTGEKGTMNNPYIVK